MNIDFNLSKHRLTLLQQPSLAAVVGAEIMELAIDLHEIPALLCGKFNAQFIGIPCRKALVNLAAKITLNT